MSNVIQVDFKKEKAERCPMVRGIEAAVPRARDLVMVADAYRTAMNAQENDEEVKTVHGLRAAAERIGITAPYHSFERVARAVQLAQRLLPEDASFNDRAAAARTAATELGLRDVEVELAVEVLAPIAEVAKELKQGDAS